MLGNLEELWLDQFVETGDTLVFEATVRTALGGGQDVRRIRVAEWKGNAPFHQNEIILKEVPSA
jgi:hypothetical protein